MKKLTLILLLALTLTLSLTACGNSGTTAETTTDVPTSSDSPVTECSHEMAEKVIAPSCTQGYTLHYCTQCTYSYSDTYTEAVGHSYESTVTEPTCTEKGYTTHTCSVCKHTYRDAETAANGHSYGDYVVTKEATPTEKGVMTSTCSACQKTQTKTYEHESNATASKGLAFYSLFGGSTARLEGLGTCTDTVVRVPAVTPDGKKVVEIGSNVFKNSKVERVILPDTVTTINEYAFAECETLTAVNIPRDVETMGNYIFQNSPNLKTVYYDAVNCTRAQNKYSDYFASTGATFKELIVGDDVKSLPPYLCLGVTTLEQVTLGKGLETIGVSAFSGTTALKSITFPEGLKKINNAAFSGSTLTEIEFPTLLETVAEYAFYACPIEQDSLILPENLEYLGERAFTAAKIGKLVIDTAFLRTGSPTYGMFEESNIGAVAFTKTVSSLPNKLFKGVSGLKSILLPEGLTSLPEQFFSECTDLESVTLSSTVTELQNFAFNGCRALKTVTGIEKVPTIRQSVFAGCTALQSVDLSGATVLGSFLFQNSGITAFTFPEGVTYLPNSFFSGCESLKSFTIPAHVTEIGVDVFRGTGITAITIPSTVKTFGQYAFARMPELATVTVEDGMTTLASWFFTDCPKLKEVNLPTTLTKIGSHVFYGCHALKSITIPDTVDYIGDYAFSGCTSLESITLPQALQCVSQSSFESCEALTEITIPDNVDMIEAFAFYQSGLVTVKIGDGCTWISDDAFAGCVKLTAVDFGKALTDIGSSAFHGCTKLEKAILPNTLKRIHDYAFSGCTALSEVDFGTSLTSISEGAFMGCTALTKLYLPESLKEFKPDTSVTNTPFKDCPSQLTFYTPLETVTSECHYFFGNIITSTSYEEYLTK